MSCILDSIEIDQDVSAIVNVAIGANVSDNTDNKISKMLLERDRLLCKERDVVIEDDDEFDDVWDSLDKFQ